MEKFNIVIVGHVDHGKSTLTGRILYDTKSIPPERMQEISTTCKELGREFEYAYLLDALLEEREGSLTIDTTQVTFRSPKREYVIIDTPGHKEFLKNMVTGASYAEAAVLIVSVADGIQEQTRRHAYILKLFGIKQIIIVINKMDQVAYSLEKFESISRQLQELFDGFQIEIQCTIPICAKEGDNVASLSRRMPWYKGQALLSALDVCKKEVCRYDFRMPVQDIYRIEGRDVIVGMIYSGEITSNEPVTVLPGGINSQIRSINIFEGKKEKARAGENVGLIIDESVKAKRGDILSNSSLPKTGRNFKALVLCIKNKLQVQESYIIQLATQEVECRIERIEERININTLESFTSGILDDADIGKVSIVTDEPLVYEDFNTLGKLGRFVLRKNADIVVAGIII